MSSILSTSECVKSSSSPEGQERAGLYAPPKYNGGNVYGESVGAAGALASVDWLTLTYQGVGVSRVLAHFGNGVLLENYHKNHYDRVWRLAVGGFCMTHSTRSDMGVCVSLPGRALDALRCLWGVSADSDLVQRAVALVAGLPEASWSCSRLDVALDDCAGALSLDVLADDVMSGRFTSLWHRDRIEVNRRGRLVDGEGVEGIEIRFGSRSSNTYLRIYDKRYERLCSGVDESVLPLHWVRAEVEFKGKQALAAVARLLDEGSLVWVGAVLRGHLEFRVPVRTDGNRRRWLVCSWWTAFLGGVRDRLHVLKEVAEQTVEHARAWLERQTPRSLALVVAADGGDLTWYRSLLAKGLKLLTPHQRAILIRMSA